MSDATHTPEPWAVRQISHVDDDLWLRIFGADEEVGEIGSNAGKYEHERVIFEQKYLVYTDERQRANARRIVACVNACAGLSTEALEAGTLAEALNLADASNGIGGKESFRCAEFPSGDKACNECSGCLRRTTEAALNALKGGAA